MYTKMIIILRARMTAKKRVTIYIDKAVHGAARRLGLNVSATCERCLRDAVERLTAG